jgi:hypothetical protein
MCQAKKTQWFGNFSFLMPDFPDYTGKTDNIEFAVLESISRKITDVMTEHSLGKIITFTANDNHPPLYYLLLRMVRLGLGTSEWALRVFSVIGAVALIGLGAGPVRRIFGNKTAFIYAAVTLFTPVILSRECATARDAERPYNRPKTNRISHCRTL